MNTQAVAIGLLLFVVATPGLRSQKTESTPANDAPVVMEPVTVTEFRTSITMRVFFHDSPTGPRVALLRIEDVRQKSPAERAGLLPGFEIVAINGVEVVGLDQSELDKLWRGPFFTPFLVLRVAPIRRGFTMPAYNISIPLKTPPPLEPLFTIRIGPKEPLLTTPEPTSEAPVSPPPDNSVVEKPSTPAPAPTAEKPPAPSPAPKDERQPDAQD